MIGKVLIKPVAVFITTVFGLIVLAGCGSSSRTNLPPEARDPGVVALFDGETFTLGEFEERYARTVGGREAAVEDSLAEYQDFLERYVNFRLKVLAAEIAGVPQSPEVSEEIRTYRANLARPYLLENEVIEPVVRQLFTRQKQLNDVSHVLIRLEETASAEDTLAAFQRASALRDSVLGGMDFGEVAFRHSEDPSARGPESRLGHRGRLGYFSAGRMIEPFETIAYETPVGGISPVFRTQFGYHFLFVHDRKDAVPDVQLSHIMIRPAPGDSAAAFDTLRVVKQRLESGEDFAELAGEYSQDTQSSARGGDLGFISYDAPIHASFKDPAFALEEPGDVSEILQTPYGLHIVKLTGRKSPQTFEESYEELKTLASRLPRTKQAEQEFAREVVLQRNARVDTAFVMSTFENIPADSVFAVLIDKRLPDAALTRPVFVLGDTIYTLRNISDYAADATLPRGGDTSDRVMSILTEFITERTIEQEAERLEQRDPEFKRIMEEFRDGLVLFQFMEDSVWTAAEQDTVALEAYYAVHAQEYWWPERSRILSIQATTDSLAGTIAARLDAGESPAAIVNSFAGDTLQTVRLDTMMIAETTNSIYDRGLELAEGEHTEPLKYRNSFIVLVNDGKEGPRQKTFDEARTQVVSDYQVILEEKLVARLRERFDAHTFPGRLVQAFDSKLGDTQASKSGG